MESSELLSELQLSFTLRPNMNRHRYNAQRINEVAAQRINEVAAFLTLNKLAYINELIIMVIIVIVKIIILLSSSSLSLLSLSLYRQYYNSS